MDERPKHRILPNATKRARKLRRESTFPERLLWGELRAGRLKDVQIRRQHVIGPYVVDFFCADAKLVIELDGESHVGRGEFDQTPTKHIEKLGFRVIRFTNDDVLQSMDAVLTSILTELGKPDASPSPQPSPFQGEGVRAAARLIDFVTAVPHSGQARSAGRPVLL